MTKPDYTDGTVLGSSPRRRFLGAGIGSLVGLLLADVLRLRAESSPSGVRPKSLIMIFLSGGPSHLDMYDMKPDAPSQIRGEFRPIATNVEGMSVCELMPRQAGLAHRFAVLRGVRLAHLHTANEFFSGYPWQQTPRVSVPGEAQRPAVGSVVSRVRGSGSAMPAYVSLNNQPDWERAYHLGLAHEPFRVTGGNVQEALESMVLRQGLSAARVRSRKGLLDLFDGLRAAVDRNDATAGLDAFQSQAVDMILSGKVRDAFDLDREPARVRERYGEKPFRVINQECNVVRHHEVEHPGRAFLRARRLAEAGVAVTTVSLYDWDTHRYNFITLRQLLPPLDQALSALVADLDERGLLDDVIVLVGGEFGRAPKIGDVTPDGRTHWPEAGFLWVAGGGLKTGQTVGATDRRGEHAVGKPIEMQNLLATIYPLLGVDPALAFRDSTGRPLPLLVNTEPVAELL